MPNNTKGYIDINRFLTGFGYCEEVKQLPQKPVVFIVGCPRSGTTLIYQFLASTKIFAYPSNLMSRFYGSARFASLVHQLLTNPDYDPMQEITDLSREVGFSSKFGKTSGSLQPSEFWYFWRRFFPLDVPSPLDAMHHKGPHIESFVAELADMEQVLGKPLLLKGMLLCFDLKLLERLFKNPIFVFVRRDAAFNAQSLLLAREQLLGDRRKWYSTKPHEYRWLRNQEPIVQVAGQIHYTNLAIEQQLADFGIEKQITIGYEHFCDNPDQLLTDIRSRFEMTGFSLPGQGPEDVKLQALNEVKLSAGEFANIVSTLEELSHDPDGFQQRAQPGDSS